MPQTYTDGCDAALNSRSNNPSIDGCIAPFCIKPSDSSKTFAAVLARHLQTAVSPLAWRSAKRNLCDPTADTSSDSTSILDFSFSAEILQAIDERAAKLVMLDHHKSAAEKLTGFTCRCGVVHFDMSKSGARLAWEFFHPHTPIPALLQYVEDRDIWKWEFEESARFLSALDMETQDFARWSEIATFSPEQLAQFMVRGAAMDEKYKKLCADIAEGAQPLVFNGIAGLMVNAPGMFHSLVGDMLSAKTGTFALMWSAGEKGVKVGLRAQRNFDCIALAESMGGGGHAQACGFKMKVERLPELLSGTFNA